MPLENPLNRNNSSTFIFSSYSSILIMQCEQLFSVVLNRTTALNNQQLTPPYIRQLLAKQNLTLRLPKNIPECVIELERLVNSTKETEIFNTKIEENYGIQERSRSLIIFVFLIAFVSLISIIGNLCLAKVLYSKRFRLLQTDRIVLCLALSELCLVLIDSPTEIYRFISYSFAQTWLCRFHTFFESFFSSCIIFYHLLGAFDRFVYIHGHTSSNESFLSTWCRRLSTKSCSIILLILPIICSLPIAICNLLHAHVLHTSSKMKICVVQYAHKILISFLIFFYILPLLFSFFLHAKLIYFIRSKHNQHYFAITKTGSYMLPTKRQTTLDSQIIIKKQRQRPNNQTILGRNQQLLQPKESNTNNRRIVMFNTNTNRNTAGSGMTITTTAAAGGQQAGTTNSSNSSGSSRSSNGVSFASTKSPIVLYKINSEANANAKRTILLLVLLLSFYVLCWAPYNIYTWSHAYQLTLTNQNEILFNRTYSIDLNETIILLTDNLHADLRRIIFINYSLYLLSMISMCFSFIFYFSLNKQARRELITILSCVCPWFINIHNHNNNTRENPFKQRQQKSKGLLYHTRYQHHYSPHNQILSPIQNNNNTNQRVKTTKFKTHTTIKPPKTLLTNRPNTQIDNVQSKRTILTYGCHVQCCK